MTARENVGELYLASLRARGVSQPVLACFVRLNNDVSFQIPMIPSSTTGHLVFSSTSFIANLY